VSFSWRYTPQLDLTGSVEIPPSFANQSDAESWIGEAWRALAAAGVASVALYADGAQLYEMSLEAE
jgi:hypothetical protein